jgi:hypothetical protein
MFEVVPIAATWHEQTVGEVLTFEPKMARPSLARMVKQGHAGTRRPRKACAACNQGWMRHIEEAAKSATTALMRGDPVWLDSRSQRAIAALMCLISVRAEFSHLSTKAESPSDRDWLRTNLEAPPLWKIWIARYVGPNADRHRLRHFGLQIVSSSDEQVALGVCNPKRPLL